MPKRKREKPVDEAWEGLTRQEKSQAIVAIGTLLACAICSLVYGYYQVFPAT